MLTNLADRLKGVGMKLCVIGLGYIGLPTAAMFASNGHYVTGVDVSARIIEALSRGETYICEPGLGDVVHWTVSEGRLIAKEVPQPADAYIICVPTPINPDHSADLSYIDRAVRSILPILRKGNMVILESTSPPGTTRNLVCSMLSESGLIPGRDLYVAYCPERVLPGRILKELVSNSRVIGGITKESAIRVRDLYSCFVRGEMYITDSTTAEMCKLVENTYRDVNIALAAELAMICENLGINAWEVIRYANKHPRVNLHQPGPGVGGHCIAVDPWFIVQRQSGTARMIELARRINDSMPRYVLDRVKTLLKDINGVRRVCVLGVTYKPNVDDLRESPVVRLISMLKAEGGYSVITVDRHADYEGSKGRELYEAVRGCHLLLLAVNHREFEHVDFRRIKERMAYPCVLDTRNFWRAEEVETAGLSYHLLGWGKEPNEEGPDGGVPIPAGGGVRSSEER